MGIEHNSIFNNFNLSDDIIEAFRPMVDYTVATNHHYHKEFDKKYIGLVFCDMDMGSKKKTKKII